MSTLYRNSSAFDKLLSEISKDISRETWWPDPWIIPLSPRRRKESFINVKDGVASFAREVPGIPKDKIAITWKDNVLSVVGKTETRSIEFKVSMPDINTKTLKAECVDGILTVSARLLQDEEEKAITVKIE